MANITKFISTGQAPEAVQQPLQQNINLNQVASPFEAHTQYLESIRQSSDALLSQFNASANEVDQLYVAQSKADTQLFLDSKFKELESKATPKGAMPVDATQAFDQYASGLLNSAPNQATQKHMMSILPGLRAKVLMKSTGYQEGLNKQQDFNNFSQAINNYTSLAVSNPDNAESIRKNIDDYAGKMTEAGYDALSINREVLKAKNSFDKTLATTLADKEPGVALDGYNKGKFTHLGEDFALSVKKRAEATINGQVKAHDKTLKGYLDRLQQGQALPEGFTQDLDQASALVPDKVKEVTTLLDYKNKVNNLNFSEIGEELFNLKLGAKSDMSLSPDELKRKENLLLSAQKAMNEDPMGYAINAGLVQPLPPLPEFKPGDDMSLNQAVRDRATYAGKAAEATGLPAIPFTKNEIDKLATEISGADTKTQLMKFQQMRAFGSDFTPELAHQVAKRNPSAGVAMMISEEDPLVAEGILKGSAKIRDKSVVVAPPLDVKKGVENVFGNLFDSDVKLRSQFIAAATALNAEEKGDGLGFEDSLRKVTGVINIDRPGIGGGLSNYNTIPPVRGMDEEGFINLTKKLNTSENFIAYGNGVPILSNGVELDPTKLNTDQLEFIPYANGQYLVSYRGNPLRIDTDLAKPYIVDLKALHEELK